MKRFWFNEKVTNKVKWNEKILLRLLIVSSLFFHQSQQSTHLTWHATLIFYPLKCWRYVLCAWAPWQIDSDSWWISRDKRRWLRDLLDMPETFKISFNQRSLNDRANQLPDDITRSHPFFSPTKCRRLTTSDCKLWGQRRRWDEQRTQRSCFVTKVDDEKELRKLYRIPSCQAIEEENGKIQSFM